MAELATHEWLSRDGGSDAPLAVLVHGVTGWWKTWWRVGPALADRGWRVVAVDLLSGSGGLDVEVDTPGACFGFLLTEARRARGRGVGLALAAHSFSVARERGFRTQHTHVWKGNAAMLAAATQLLGFTIIGNARRLRVIGITRWSWQIRGQRASGARLVL